MTMMIGRLLLSPLATRHASSSSSTTLRLLLLRTSVPKSRTAPSNSLTTTTRMFSDKTNAKSSPPPAVEPPKPNNSSSSSSSSSPSWWNSAEFWGRCGALAGWGMSGAAIYDALESSPELISLNMTGVLLVYSSLFARWAMVVKPQNLLLAGCHVANIAAQGNQLRRAIEYKRENGKEDEVQDILVKAGLTVAAGAACVMGGPMVQNALVNANLGPISTVAAADAGPFTVHFWAPMSKWMISGASFLELDRPTEKISLAQYSALTLTGFFFSRYALLVTPINYTLCSVNIALFGSSAWHLGRKIKADYVS